MEYPLFGDQFNLFDISVQELYNFVDYSEREHLIELMTDYNERKCCFALFWMRIEEEAADWELWLYGLSFDANQMEGTH